MDPAHLSAAPAAGKGVLLFLAGSIAPSIEISRVKYHKKSSTLVILEMCSPDANSWLLPLARPSR